MKVKHWAGYGTVEMVTLSRCKGYVAVRISGNHERGLLPRYFDYFDWHRWIGKRLRIESPKDIEKIEPIEFWDEKRHEDVMEVSIFTRR